MVHSGVLWHRLYNTAHKRVLLQRRYNMAHDGILWHRRYNMTQNYVCDTDGITWLTMGSFGTEGM